VNCPALRAIRSGRGITRHGSWNQTVRTIPGSARDIHPGL
jgi:hypothetical protein